MTLSIDSEYEQTHHSFDIHIASHEPREAIVDRIDYCGVSA